MKLLRNTSGKKLSRSLEIEPLSEARWARVERAVLDAHLDAPAPETATREAKSWRMAAAFLVLAGAFAAISGALAWRVLSPAGRENPTRVETAANGSRVEFGESTIDVGPTSAVRLAGDDAHGITVTLDRGRVECDVAPRLGRPPFAVEAGSVEVRVIGTHFAVTRAGDAVSVDVQRGEVEVASSGNVTLVPAGSHWPSVPPASPPAPATPASATTAGTTPPDAHETGRPAPADAHPPGAGAPHPQSGLSAREQYDTASRLEAQQPDAALAIYRDLARRGGAWGENALFAAGRLEADRGADDEARALLREYRAKYPAGPNANDARQLLDRLR
jgi:FecR protein